jgi:hypothetical protein
MIGQGKGLVMAGVYEQAEKLVAAASIASSELNNCTMHLFSNNYIPSGKDTIASFTEAAFSGYANATIATWGTPFYDGAGNAKTVATSVEFTQNGGNITDVAYGYWLQSGNSTILGAQRFTDAPIAFNGAGNSVVVLAEVTLALSLDCVEVDS